MSKSVDAFLNGLSTSTKNSMLFVPSLGPIVIHIFFVLLAYVVFPIRISYWWLPYEIVAPNPYLDWGGRFIAFIVGFIASCVVVDMANDAINQRPVDFNKSLNAVMGQLGTLIITAIISAILSITFILIPVALFLVAITIIERTDAIESTKRTFDFVINNLGEVIVFIILVIGAWIIFGLVFLSIPVVGVYVGAVISWILNVIFTVASVHFYLSLRQAPPPPSS